MKSQHQTKTQQILTIMKILAWIAFIGFSIEVCAALISYGVSIVHPEVAETLYKKIDLHHLREYSFWYYTCAFSFLIAIPILKSYTWFLVIRILSKLNITNPFKMEVALTLERISYLLLGTWIVSILTNGYFDWLRKITGELLSHGSSGEFIFVAGLVFVISQIFKRGIEIQNENELTV